MEGEVYAGCWERQVALDSGLRLEAWLATCLFDVAGSRTNVAACQMPSLLGITSDRRRCGWKDGEMPEVSCEFSHSGFVITRESSNR